ncbi:MAG: portal protein [Luminiphilus sp.]
MEYGNGSLIEQSEAEMGLIEPMDDSELEALVGGELTDAVSFIDAELSPVRARAIQYYRGEPFGNEEEGRSQVVSTDVRDTINGIMPSLMRVFFGSRSVVQFVPRSVEDIPVAEQATDYVNYIFNSDNNGFTICHSVFKDALRGALGIVKFYWEEKAEVKTEMYTGLDESALTVLLDEPNVVGSAIESMDDPSYQPPVDPMTGQPMLDPMTGMPPPVPQIYNVELKREYRDGRVKVCAVPPEEFLIDRRATSVEDATLIAHRRMMRVSDLVALGYDKDEVEEQMGAYELDSNDEYIARNPYAESYGPGGTQDDKRVLYVEAYMRIDYDRDGISELRKVCTIGPSYKVVMNEPCSHRPFATFCPDPEPHAFIGMSIFDMTADLQKIKSAIMRNMLDSLSLAIHPRVGVVEGQVNMDDVLNTEVGGVIRQRAPGMVQPFSVPFVGQAAFPMLSYLDEVRETRTGMSKASMGLDPGALQSTTRAAVAATVSASQQHLELIARIFAETGMRTLFKGILKLVVENQDRPRVVRLRNQWVPIDPRSWQSEMDVEINVALGGGTEEQKVATLTSIAQKQEAILQMMGPQNPIVTPQQYRNTLARLTEVSGFKNPDEFFLNPAMQPPMPPPQPPPDPTAMLAQVEMQKIQADITNKQAELELKRQQTLLQDDRDRDKQEADIMLKAYEIQLKYGSQIDMNEIKAMMDAPRAASPSVQNPPMPEITPFVPQPPLAPQPDMGMMPPDMGMAPPVAPLMQGQPPMNPPPVV